jgi:hypothetical protein
MAVSQGNFSSGPVGLTLVAWVLFRGATGAVVASSGISGVSRTAAGTYTVTFTSARPNTDYLPVVTLDQPHTSTQFCPGTGAKAVGSFGITMNSEGYPAADASMVHVAVYA